MGDTREHPFLSVHRPLADDRSPVQFKGCWLDRLEVVTILTAGLHRGPSGMQSLFRDAACPGLAVMSSEEEGEVD